tara:strand:+ start:20398 stop:22083 length:1686 start_codon:yes stop_codon:yes gene_type:complete
MLETLQIRGLATIESVDLELASGFTALSGETGAGKSILIDALGLVLGARADAALVRDGKDRAEVTALFHVPESSTVRHWLEQQSLLDDSEPDACLLRRVLHAEGRTRAFINGTAVSVGQLRELGEQLVDVFGQNESHSLRLPEEQRRLLDDYAGHGPLLADVSTCARRWHSLQQEIERVSSAATRDPAQLDLLRHQLQELEALKLQPDELSEIEVEHKRLANSGRLLKEGAAVQDVLYAGDNSIHDQLAASGNILQDLAQLDPQFAETESLIASAQTQVREAASELRRLLDRLDLDPQRLNEVEARMSEIHDLARKHRVRPDALHEKLDQMRTEIAESESADGMAQKLKLEQDKAHEAYLSSAAKLSKARKSVSARYAKEVSRHVRELGMPDAELKISLEPAQRKQPSTLGEDDLRFDFSANPGQAPRPLAKVASGGELSRISLAIQVVAQQSGGAPTMIFDEVDAGIGGAVADAVGRLLQLLGKERQILCVTHLGQVAACGAHHLAVGKQVSKNKTFTSVTALDAEGRVREITRMIGGKKPTAATESMARELLKVASAQT